MSNLLVLLKNLGVPIETKVFIETFNKVNYEYVYQMQMDLNWLNTPNSLKPFPPVNPYKKRYLTGGKFMSRKDIVKVSFNEDL